MAVLLLVMGTFAKRGWLDLRRMKNQNAEIESRLSDVRNQKMDLEQKLLALKRNPSDQEQVVRRVLGYVKSNEYLIEFP